MEQTKRTILFVDTDNTLTDAVAASLEKHPQVKTIQALDESAIGDYMNQRGVFENPAASPRPSMILLGRTVKATDSVVEEVRAHPLWKSIPIIHFTNASSPADLSKRYGSGINAVIDWSEGQAISQDKLSAFARFWLETVKLPDPQAK